MNIPVINANLGLGKRERRSRRNDHRYQPWRHACRCGERTVIADLDAQGSAPSWHHLRGGDSPSVVSVAPGNLQRVKDGSLALGVSLLIIDTPGHLGRSNACRDPVRDAYHFTGPPEPLRPSSDQRYH